jgi:hypothetical protein
MMDVEIEIVGVLARMLRKSWLKSWREELVVVMSVKIEVILRGEVMLVDVEFLFFH